MPDASFAFSRSHVRGAGCEGEGFLSWSVWDDQKVRSITDMTAGGDSFTFSEFHCTISSSVWESNSFCAPSMSCRVTTTFVLGDMVG